jgi:two-component system alkaline phosphatase synthesis response regulator PhoP
MEKKKILLIDDEEDIVTTLKFKLEDEGYALSTASDGFEGLKKAKGENPDLIILDIMMPKMDGHKVCGLLKKDKKTSHIPIIMFTAKVQDEDRKLAGELGADAYITKPFEPAELLEKLKSFI